jgi:SAM-dependent methyltransferase
MTNDWFKKIAITHNIVFNEGRWISGSIDADAVSSWSFSAEWKTHQAKQQQKTWDWTAAERLQHFYKETRTTPIELPGKTVLDAGCGNGQLTKAFAEAGAYAVGIDLHAHLPQGNGRLQFVQCDINNAPFLPGSFDIVIANGSIHHTKNTRDSFSSLALLTRPGSKLYVWVYKKQKGKKMLLLRLLDISRFFINRLPAGLQRLIINLLTWFFYLLSRVRKGENSSRSKDEIRINVYDAFTPRYRSYHTIEEVSKWFEHSGFDSIELTHDGNPYGFGILGIKK